MGYGTDTWLNGIVIMNMDNDQSLQLLFLVCIRYVDIPYIDNAVH